jgi:hypothetical protein
MAAAGWGQEGEVSQSVPRPFGHCCIPAPDSQRDRLAHRPHGNDVGSVLVRRKLELLASCGGRRRRGLLAPAELAAVGPHAVQDHRELAGHRHACACHAPALGEVHLPRPQRRPFGAADQQRVRRWRTRQRLDAASSQPGSAPPTPRTTQPPPTPRAAPSQTSSAPRGRKRTGRSPLHGTHWRYVSGAPACGPRGRVPSGGVGAR